MAFGGHYLSDVLLGGLVTLIVIEIVRRVIWPLGASEPESLGRPELRGAPAGDGEPSRRPAD